MLAPVDNVLTKEITYNNIQKMFCFCQYHVAAYR